MRSFVVGVALLIAAPVFADTGFLDRNVTVKGTSYRYQVYVPSDYTPDKEWPVIVDMHGGGAQGSDGIRQTAHFLADQIRMARARFPLVVVFPQAAPGTSWTSPVMQELVMAELDSAVAEFHGDPHRVYLTGFSMGAAGVYSIAAKWPERFAALVAIGGVPHEPFAPLTERIRGIPVWIFNAAAADRVPVAGSRKLVEALQKAGADVLYTEYPGADHGADAVSAWADPELVTWLLAKRRR